jgi:trimeric autotransporter adhesin
MLNWKTSLLGAALCLVTAAPTFAQTVGNVNLVKVWAYGRDSGNANWADLYQSDPVLMAQALRTPIGGAMHVRFTDDTDLRLGSEAEIVVDRFVFNPSTGVGALQAEIGKGVLRFITGRMRKDGVRIGTPAAVIGVRGTDFIVQVAGDGTTTVQVIEGEVTITPRGGGETASIPAGQTAQVAMAATSVAVGVAPPAADPGVSENGGEGGDDGASDGGGGGDGGGSH